MTRNSCRVAFIAIVFVVIPCSEALSGRMPAPAPLVRTTGPVSVLPSAVTISSVATVRRPVPVAPRPTPGTCAMTDCHVIASPTAGSSETQPARTTAAASRPARFRAGRRRSTISMSYAPPFTASRLPLIWFRRQVGRRSLRGSAAVLCRYPQGLHCRSYLHPARLARGSRHPGLRGIRGYTAGR